MPSEIQEIDSICAFCGLGCSMTATVHDNAICRAYSKPSTGVNQGRLCLKGQYSYEFLHSSERLQHPLIKKNERLWQVSWEEAIEAVVLRALGILKKYGPQSIGGIASMRCTNEANYLFQKFLRVAIGTNNIDSRARMGYAGCLQIIENLLGQGAAAHSIERIKKAKTIFVIGADPTVINPILGLAILDARQNGARVYALGRYRGLTDCAALQVLAPMFKEIELLEHLVAHIAAQRKIQKLPDPLSQWIAQKAEFLNANYPKSVPKNEFIALLNGLLQDGPCAIVFGPQIAQFHQGHKLIALVAALTYLLDAKLFLLSHSPNEHGAVDMGCVPDALAGNIPIANHEGLKYVERLWNEPLSSRRGLTLMEMIEAADSGQLKALYIMGDNPAFNLPDTPKTTRALQNLELLIVQDVFHTETVALAHIALPATSWGQTDGTYINLERRIQRVRKWVDGARLEDWRIMNELLCEMGYDADYREASQVFDEIATVSPMHKGLSYQDLEPDGCLFPYRGDPVKSERNKPIEINMKGAMTFEGSIYLSVEDSPYHAGVLSRYCPSLRKLSPSPSLKLSPSLFQELKLFEGQRVIATSALGSLEVEAEQDPFLPPDIAMLTNHFEQAGAYRLIGYTLDPVTKIPGVRGWKITIIPKTF